MQLSGVLMQIASVFTVKLLRRDFFMYIPVTSIILAAVLAVISTLSQTLLVDFLGMACIRHPVDLGGLLWWQGLLWPWALLITLMFVYNGPFSVNAVQMLGVTLILGDIIARLVFAALTRPSHRQSFLAPLETGPAYVHRVKWTGQSDEVRARTLKCYHTSYLQPFREEARQWLSQNWKNWERDRPMWFTERWKQAVPKFLLPAEIKRMLKNDGGRKRRSTLQDQLGIVPDPEISGSPMPGTTSFTQALNQPRSAAW